MPLDLALFESLHFHTIQLLAGFDVPDLKAQTLVDTDKNQRLPGVDCERSNVVGERANRVMRGMRR